MIRETYTADINSVDDSFRAGLEHSFFRNIQDNITKENHFEPVYNFSLDDDETKSLKREDFNEHHVEKENFKERLLSTKSTSRDDSQNLASQKLQSSNSHLFFSGYFGEKKEDVRGGDANCANYTNYTNNRYQSHQTNPFAFNEADNSKRAFAGAKALNTNNHVELVNVNTKILNNNQSSFNGSFLSASMSNLNRSTNVTKYASNPNSFNDLVKSVSISNLSASKSKKKILSTEEMIIEKIKKEKEEMLKLKMINRHNVEKVKTFVSKPAMPQPLTLIKPFNLSMNQSKMLMKKRVTNSSIDEINSKITDVMKKKCFGENVKDTLFAHEKIVLQKSEQHVRHMKKSLGRSISRSISRSRSPLKVSDANEDDVTNLTSRIEKYCVISGYKREKNANNINNRSKSPQKNCFSHRSDFQANEDKIFNNQVNSILLNTSRIGQKSTSIRKHFNSGQMTTEERIVKEMQGYKFTPKPLNKTIFKNKKTNDVEPFDSILMKTRMEKQDIEKMDKDKKKTEKINQMKFNKLTKDNKIGGYPRMNKLEDKENFSSNLIDAKNSDYTMS